MMYQMPHLQRKIKDPVASLVKISKQEHKWKSAFDYLRNNVSLKLKFSINKPPLIVSLFDHAYMENILCYK